MTHRINFTSSHASLLMQCLINTSYILDSMLDLFHKLVPECLLTAFGVSLNIIKIHKWISFSLLIELHVNLLIFLESHEQWLIATQL